MRRPGWALSGVLAALLWCGACLPLRQRTQAQVYQDELASARNEYYAKLEAYKARPTAQCYVSLLDLWNAKVAMAHAIARGGTASEQEANMKYAVDSVKKWCRP
jgi:hypothetical protein